MSLRTSIALKLIAIILFSFGMMAPVLISSTGSTGQETQICCDGHLANVVTSFLFEENEEEGIVLEFIEAPSTAFTTEFRHITLTRPREITSSQPALFTLFHTYII